MGEYKIAISDPCWSLLLPWERLFKKQDLFLVYLILGFQRVSEGYASSLESLSGSSSDEIQTLAVSLGKSGLLLLGSPSENRTFLGFACFVLPAMWRHLTRSLNSFVSLIIYFNSVTLSVPCNTLSLCYFAILRFARHCSKCRDLRRHDVFSSVNVYGIDQHQKMIQNQYLCGLVKILE